jgi:hypothetical protein
VAGVLLLLLLGFIALWHLGSQVQDTFGDVSGHLDQVPDQQAAQPRPTYPYESHADEAGPKAEAPPGPDLAAPSGGGGNYEAPSTGGGFDAAVGIDGGGGGGGGELSVDGSNDYVTNEAPLPPPLPEPSTEAEGQSLDAPSSGGSHNFEIPSSENDGSVLPGNPALQPPETSLPDEEMVIGGRPPPERAGQLPEFPWPPPSASTSYVLPDKLFTAYRTVGEVTGAILGALEQNGYVERSFFRTPPGGVALVTRLERINDDGSSSAEARWPIQQAQASTRGLLDFLQGLFFVDPGHYRVIVFVVQDLPFSQSAESITAQQAQAWLTIGANVLTPEIAALPFAGAHVTVLIYEFASDGSKVQVITSQLTGKQHLEKAGLLAVLDKVQ